MTVHQRTESREPTETPVPHSPCSDLRDEVPRTVAEEHQHGQQSLGLFSVVIQALQEQLQAALWSQLTDEGPQLG